MATKKPAPKKAAKPAAKKAAPIKKAVKPAPKAAAKKPAPKKVVKPAPKPVSKTTSKPVKKAAANKPVAKKPAPKPKPVVKTKTKPAAKQEINHKINKHDAVQKTKPLVSKTVSKKQEPLKEIKPPKTSVKTSVPYEPGYTPLEKRADNSKTNEPLVRYSDNELAEFKELIMKKYDAAKKELAYLQGLITRKDDMGGDEGDNRYMTMEDGGMSMEREQLSQMASRQITYIDHLEKALIRIENKTYGICRVTGKLIDKARLRAVPHATLSLEAKLGIVKSSNEQ